VILMIERHFVNQKKKEFEIQNYVINTLGRAGLSSVKIQRTPLGERIIIETSRPGLVVGRAGENIKRLTRELKEKFNLENPQVEIAEVRNVNLNPRIVAEKIAVSLERYGSKRFKAILHRAIENIMKSGALGAEIILSGKVPSQRAKSWRVAAGYLRKCGEVAIEGIKRATTQAQLKSGVVGIKVSITPPDINLVDKIIIKEEQESQQQGSQEQQEQKTQVQESNKESTTESTTGTTKQDDKTQAKKVMNKRRTKHTRSHKRSNSKSSKQSRTHKQKQSRRAKKK